MRHNEHLVSQALLKAKYCPRVAAASRTQKTPKNPRDLDLDILWVSGDCEDTYSCKISSR